MRIGLNATCFNDRPSGANQRFSGIYGTLIRRRPDIEFVIYEPADCSVARWFDGAPNVLTRRTPITSTGRIARRLRAPAYWRSAFARDRLDLFETFHLPLIKSPDCPTLLTVHDIRQVLPGVPWPKRVLYGAVLNRSLRRADHVVTVSDTMKQEIRALQPKAAVTTIYNGIDIEAFGGVAEADAAETGRRFGLPPGFVLAVGHLEARKNYDGLIRAVRQLRDSGRPISLAIVGNDGGEGPRIRAEIGRLGLSEHVAILQGVSDKELTELYAWSGLVVFPSRYEGFGIPILEAMAARRPLALSDIPVFRELTEGQGAYFPPDDSAAMAAVIEGILSSPVEQERLVGYGDRRVRAFSFSNLAAQVEQVYRSLLRR